MEKRPKSVDLGAEAEHGGEVLSDELCEQMGETVLHVNEVVAEQARASKDYESDILEFLRKYEEEDDIDEEAASACVSGYIDAIAAEGNWGDGIRFLDSCDSLGDDVIITFLEKGMPVDFVLDGHRDELLRVCESRVLPEGVLSDIYESLSRDDEGRDFFKREFIDSRRADLTIAGFLDVHCRDGGGLDEKQRNDVLLFREMGGDVFNAGIDGYHHFHREQWENNSEDQEIKPRAYSRNIFECIRSSGLLDDREAGRVLERMADGEYVGDYKSDLFLGLTDKIIDSGMEVNAGSDADYWLHLCRDRGENVFDRFCHFWSDDGSLFSQFDFSNEVVMSLLATSLSRETISARPSFYIALKKSGLLESEEFQEKIVSAIGDSVDMPIKKYGRYYITTGAEALLSEDGLLERIKERGLFEKYPECLREKTIAGFVNGEMTEQDRLKLILHRDSSEQFDENGNPTDAFYLSITSEHVGNLLFLNREERDRAIEVLLDNGQHERLYSTDVGSREKAMMCRGLIKRKGFEFFKELGPDGRKKAGLDDVYMEQFVDGLGAVSLRGDGVLDDNNAIAALTRFIYMDDMDWSGADEADLRIKEAFAEGNIANKDKVMLLLRRAYEDYLHEGNSGTMPPSIQVLAEYMHQHGGAGPLTQVESFLGYLGEIGRTDNNDILADTKLLEARIKGWDNISKANFYSIATEVLRADEQIYAEFLSVFGRIEDEKDFKVFTQEIFPLFRAKLALLKQYDDHSNGIGRGYQESNYGDIDKNKLRNDLHNALIPFTFLSRGEDENDKSYKERREKGIALVKEKIFAEISELFMNKFGIRPEVVPTELDKEGMRSIEDMVLYLSNIANPSEKNKNLIGYYLALQLSKRSDGGSAWEDFRKGKSCDPFEFLTDEAASSVAEAISRSNETNPITVENTHIEDQARRGAFIEALQDEVSEIRIGGISTIDVRLQNLSSNIEELADPDLYEDPMDKAKIQLVGQYSSKMIGRVATALWSREAKGKATSFSEEEAVLAGELEKLLADNDIELTPDNINKYLQQGFKEFGPVAKTLALIREKDVRGKVAELQDMLIPSGEVAKIFGELGEEFRPESGILALNADLDFLESVIAKGEKTGMLSGDEAERQRKIGVLRAYLGQIEASMAGLDAIYNDIVSSFSSIRGMSGENAGGDTGMEAKLREIRGIISGKSESSHPVIVSHCSHSMTNIVENMRACLSCKTKGINNDTDLTFGENYKFYLYSQTGAKESGSISDEIAFFVPVATEGGERRMSFVMDRIYGTANSDILLGHIAVLEKKARALKARFPEVPISILVTSSGASSCSVPIDAANLLARLNSIEGVTVSAGSRVVSIPESGLGDHYIEITNGIAARQAGDRIVNGIEVVF